MKIGRFVVTVCMCSALVCLPLSEFTANAESYSMMEKPSQREQTLSVKPEKSSLRVLPVSKSYWRPQSSLSTPWGIVAVSQTSITRAPIRVTLTKNNRTKVLYTLLKKGGKELLGWATAGHYLLLNFEETGDSKPTTGDVGGWWAVVDLRSGNTVDGGDIGQETDMILSLSPNYLFIRKFELTGAGYAHVLFTYDIVSLSALRHVGLQMLDNNVIGDKPYLTQDRIFYYAHRPDTGIYDFSIPKNVWCRLAVNKVYRLVIK